MANIFAPQPLPSSPTSQQTTTGSINTWAQPYVNNLLTKAQGLSADPTALQQQSYQSAAGMQVAPQLGEATGMATGAAQGAMGTAGTALDYGQQGAGYGAQGLGYGQQGVGLGVTGGAQYGQQGASYGQQATQAGQNYANMATSPAAIQAYMSPYVQQALAPQLQMLNQQQAIAGQGINAQAAGQGAFGGNRATLAQGLNAQNYDLARQQAIGQGYQNAFTQAQQAQQFGSTLGLQGLQTGIQGAQAGLQGVQGAQNAYGMGLQGASTLGQLGQNQYNQQMGIAGLQNQLGTQQYLMPQQLLQTKQSMLQGLPVGSQTIQGYQSGPSQASQIGGLGTAALGTLGLLNQAGALNGIRNLFPGGGNNITTTDTPIDTTVTQYVDPNEIGGSAGGLPKNFKYKSYAKGGLVKSGSDLADIRLYALLG